MQAHNRPRNWWPTLRFVLHRTDHGDDEIDNTIERDHLQKYPKFETWKQRSGLRLPLPEFGVSPPDIWWRQNRLPDRNNPVRIDMVERQVPQEQEVPNEVGNITVHIGQRGRFRHVRKAVPKHLQADSDLTLTDLSDTEVEESDIESDDSEQTLASN